MLLPVTWVLAFLVQLCQLEIFALADERFPPPPRFHPLCQCGKLPPTAAPPEPEQNGNRIIGGEETVNNEFPWYVVIYLNGAHHCGGSLITDRWALSAGHCFIPDPGPSMYTVSLGVNSNADPTRNLMREDFRIVQVYVPPYNGQPTEGFDIALLLLDRPVNLNAFPTVCLPLPTASYEERNATVIGLGIINAEANIAAAHLRKAIVPIFQTATCPSMMATGKMTFPTGTLCGGFPGTDTCKGDSGGPLMMPREFPVKPNTQYELIGLTSYGPTMCGNGIPGVYTSVPYYMPWIELAMAVNGGAGLRCVH